MALSRSCKVEVVFCITEFLGCWRLLSLDQSARFGLTMVSTSENRTTCPHRPRGGGHSNTSSLVKPARVPTRRRARRPAAHREALISTTKNEGARYRSIIHQIVVRLAAIDVKLDRTALRQLLRAKPDDAEDDQPRLVELSIPVRLYRTGHELRLVINNGGRADEAGTLD